MANSKIKELTKTFRELPQDMDVEIEEFRCVNCGRFLGLIALVEGTVVIRCRRCKIWSVIDIHREIELDKTDKNVYSEIKVEIGHRPSEGESPPGSVETGVI